MLKQHIEERLEYLRDFLKRNPQYRVDHEGEINFLNRLLQQDANYTYRRENRMLTQHIEERARYIISKLQLNGTFYMAGGCFDQQIRDVDIFGYDGPKINAAVIVETKNATTYATLPWRLQICKYLKPTLAALLESFDFAHCQVGVKVKDRQILEVTWTKAFEDARLTQQTWFTGSEYPLASLFRLEKYKQRGLIKAIKSKIAILTAIYKRGFIDYDDFKDQLDAVDLGLVPAEYKGAIPELKEFYELLLQIPVRDDLR